MAAVTLSPIGNGAQFFDSVGRVLAGGLLNTYTAGTSTPLATYTTTLGTITNANPTVLGADGRPPAEIWLEVGSSYKFVLTDSLGNILATYDDIKGINDLNNVSIAGTLTVAGASTLASLNVSGNTILGDATGDGLTVNPSVVTWSGNPTHTGNHTFSGNVSVTGNHGVSGTQTVATQAITGNQTVAGTSAFTGVVTQNANPAGRTIGDSYTPTLTNVTNVSASTALAFFYTRMGPIVSVTGGITATTTGAGTATVNISLPVASAFASNANATGVVSTTGATTHFNGSIVAVVVSNLARLDWTCTGAGATSLFFEFKYLVI